MIEFRKNKIHKLLDSQRETIETQKKIIDIARNYNISVTEENTALKNKIIDLNNNIDLLVNNLTPAKRKSIGI